jgi:threonine/homoserine/homoserine lactone efflux protein
VGTEYHWCVPSIWAFLAVTVPLVLTPGVSTAVVLRNSVSRGTLAGLGTAIGVNTGSVCFGLLCAFGFTLVLRQFPQSWMVLRVAGFVYLAWLGIQSLRRARRPLPPSSARVTSGSAEPSGLTFHDFREGFITNVSNPALATFYFLVLPGFLPGTGSFARGVLILTAVHVAIAATWHTVWAVAGGTLAPVLSSGRPRQALDAVSGIALIYLAVRFIV